MRHNSRDRWHCHACNKTAYGSKSRAEQTMASIWVAEADSGRVVPQRAYECPYNPGSWHLTSKSERSAS